MAKMSWETEEVIKVLINDAGCHSYLHRADADTIRAFVEVDKMAPEWLYKGFERYKGQFRAVDWKIVAKHLR